MRNLCRFTECYCLLYAYVRVYLFAFSCYAGFSFFASRIVAVALAVRNRTSANNGLDLLLGIKRVGEHTDEVPSLRVQQHCKDTDL